MTMDYKRLALYAALMLVVMTLWSKWQQEHPAQAVKTHVTMTQSNNAHGNYVPTSAIVPDAVPAGDKKQVQNLNVIPTGQIIKVRTDTLSVEINSVGGNLTTAKLIKFPEELHSKAPYVLLNDEPSTLYVAQSGMTGLNKENKPITFLSTKTSYQMADNEKQLQVTLTGQTASGLKVNKIYTFTRGSYLVNVGYQITNNSSKAWQGQFYTQLVRAEPPSTGSSLFHIASFTGASMSDPANKMYKKISYKDMSKNNLNQLVKGGWVAMQEHYFLSAWVPDSTTVQQRFYTHATDNNLYTIGMIGSALNVGAGQTQSTMAKLYMGPEKTDLLKSIAPGLNLTVDYGFLWFIAVAIFWLMQKIYSVIGNWGWSIVFVTVFIKLAFYKLSATSYKSMANMRKLQPRLQQIKERYGDDKAKLSQATMEMYKKEKINPLGGCLPIIVQIPVFIALYWVLLESVELRQAPFMLWIHDLAAPDPFYILPVLMGITMFIQQKLNPPPPDPTQAKVMMFLPIVFTFLFLHFPSGLVLYWVVNNLLSILQQWHITRKIEAMGTAKKVRR